eukprot:TRINITY_DN58734_c0_g1_i1.p1 TRINITY_DN58734_c0_g1~~TRINITY_DN58734_c0_g1_i1.p1  ORF type:complete len:374 (+),score=49.29 TRINITY_DN58734_c0_g1_i1:47-1168(+)
MDPVAIIKCVFDHVQNLPSRDQAEVTIEASPDTEWHEVFVVTVGATRVLVNIPSWTGSFLQNKLQVSRIVADSGLGPGILAVVPHAGKYVVVNEFLNGGTLKPDELDIQVTRDVGCLYAQFHSISTEWFEPIGAQLVKEGVLPDGGVSWASCHWILQWLMRSVPKANRESLESAGVNWDFLASEIDCLRSDPALPQDGASTRIVCVHGDSHVGNIMWHDSSLRLIDFDMTAPGPAGSEFAYIVLMLFRCGFSKESILPRSAQRAFAAGYLERCGMPTDVNAVLDDFLFDMHRWAYVGMLKMGLLCAVLMCNDGHAQKREVMRLRGPVLLNPDFLKQSKHVIVEAVRDSSLRESLLTHGLFFTAEERWLASKSS